jgi:hypothetical protein
MVSRALPKRYPLEATVGAVGNSVCCEVRTKVLYAEAREEVYLDVRQ